MLNRYSALLIPSLLMLTSLSSAADCGVPGAIVGKKSTYATRVFADGSIAVRAPLAVNPDGGVHSYTVGDHGFTYIANGISAWNSGHSSTCTSNCRIDFLEAEKKGFITGTKEFCVYAMEVEALTPGKSIVGCGTGRHVIGNGKGRLKLGPLLETVADRHEQGYLSTTSLKHTVNGHSQYLDAESLPIAVTPDIKLLGSVVWVGGTGLRSTYALIGDSGPDFGEGSIALHQFLRAGAVSPQKIGPIPVDLRCGASELDLKAPFESRPDTKNDACRPGYKAKSQSDIRAYGGISQSIEFVVLGKANFPMKKSIIEDTVTTDSIKKSAEQMGYTEEKIKAMISCLPPPLSN